MRSFLISALLAVMAITCIYETSYAGQVQVRLVNGDSVIGDAVLNKDEKTVRVKMEGQELTFKFEEVTPASLFALMNRDLDDKDEAGRYELALFARDHALYTSAIRELNKVIELDGDLKETCEQELPQVYQSHQEALLAELEARIEAKEWKDARKTLKELVDRYPESPTAKLARAMEADIAKGEAANAPNPAKFDKTQLRNLKIAQEKWDAVNAMLDKARDLNTDGLNYETAGLAVRAQQALLGSAEAYEAAIAQLEDLREFCKQYDYVNAEYGENKAKGYDVESTRKKSRIKVVDVLLNLGVSYMNNDMFEDATKACNRVLTIDDENREAMKLKVEIAKRKSAAQR